MSVYRVLWLEEDLKAVRIFLEGGLHKATVNQSYYSIFYAIRFVNMLDGFDATKHSSVSIYFNKFHVHTGDLKKRTYKIINPAYRIRENMFWHSVAKFLVEEEISISCVLRFLGHSSIKTTQIYYGKILGGQDKQLF